MPAPAPSELRSDERTRAETPAAATRRTRILPRRRAAYSVAATTVFRGVACRIPNGASSNDRDVPVAAANTANTDIDAAEDATTAEAQQADMPLVWPVAIAADRAAAAPAVEPAPGVGHLVIFLAATAAFVAIAFRTILKLSSTCVAARSRALSPESRAGGMPVIRRARAGAARVRAVDRSDERARDRAGCARSPSAGTRPRAFRASRASRLYEVSVGRTRSRRRRCGAARVA